MTARRVGHSAGAPAWARVGAAGVGAAYVVLGAWGLIDPVSFYEDVATFAPRNDHLVRDAAAFQLCLGLVAVVVAVRGGRLHMAAVALASWLHLGSHVADVDQGGSPARDLVSLALLAVVATACTYRIPGGANGWSASTSRRRDAHR